MASEHLFVWDNRANVDYEKRKINKREIDLSSNTVQEFSTGASNPHSIHIITAEPHFEDISLFCKHLVSTSLPSKCGGGGTYF